jgi:hypothetical protein
VVNQSLADSPDFTGMLFFADLTGLDRDPDFAGLGTRFLLCFAPEAAL